MDEHIKDLALQGRKKKYSIILADPPFAYDDVQKNMSSAADHYPVMTIDEMAVLPVPDIVYKPSCLLFMWAGGPKISEAVKLGEHWGLSYRTIAFVWDKMRPNHGRYTLSGCEFLLLFRSGCIPYSEGFRPRQLQSFRRGTHSEKPTAITELIDKMYPACLKIELFARIRAEGFIPKRPLGWDTWGNE